MNILHTEGEVSLQQHINSRKKERHNGSEGAKSFPNNRISNNNNTESLQELLRAPP